MTTAVVSTFKVATRPQIGGHFWVYLNYARGLRELGCDVYWLEWLPPDADTSALPTFFRRMERYGFGDRVILYRTSPDTERDVELVGATPAQAEAVFGRADVLLNFHYAIDPLMLRRFRRTALIDIDPGLLQYWMSHGQIEVPAHDLYLTIGEGVNATGAQTPDCGIDWIHIAPAVCLDLWPYVHNPGSRLFTTVSTWLGGEYVTDGKSIIYGNDKRDSFLQFADLPAHTSCELALALSLNGRDDADDRRLLEQKGWRVRHSLEVSGTPEDYRAYVQQSRGEFSCAKPSYVHFQNAWVSDRTLCYLASGKPVVVQHTGPSSFLPNGEGMFRFSTIDEAVAALSAIEADYERHCRAARGIAEAFFDARTVLSQVLDAVERTARFEPSL